MDLHHEQYHATAGDSDDDTGTDDIAAFEQKIEKLNQKATTEESDEEVVEGAVFADELEARRRAKVLKEDSDYNSDDSDAQLAKARARERPQNPRQQAEAFQYQLDLKNREIAALRQDLSVVAGGGPTTGDVAVPGDAGVLRQRLLEMGRKQRHANATLQAQKAKIAELEKKISCGGGSSSSSVGAFSTSSHGGGGVDGPRSGAESLDPDQNADFRKKFLAVSNRLQETRQELSALRNTNSRLRRALAKELGGEDQVDEAVGKADDPFAVFGRAKELETLRKQVSLLQREMTMHQNSQSFTPSSMESKTKQTATLGQLADQKRAQLEKLEKDNAVLEKEIVQVRRKEQGARGRTKILEKTVAELKVHAQALVEKSEKDDELVQLLRKEIVLARRDGGERGGGVPTRGMAAPGGVGGTGSGALGGGSGAKQPGANGGGAAMSTVVKRVVVSNTGASGAEGKRIVELEAQVQRQAAMLRQLRAVPGLAEEEGIDET